VIQNIYFKWLSGMSYPGHNTINRFRSDRIKGALREVFTQIVLLLIEKGILTLKEVLKKAEIEVGLLVLSNNLRKIAASNSQKNLVFIWNPTKISPKKYTVLKIIKKT